MPRRHRSGRWRERTQGDGDVVELRDPNCRWPAHRALVAAWVNRGRCRDRCVESIGVARRDHRRARGRVTDAHHEVDHVSSDETAEIVRVDATREVVARGDRADRLRVRRWGPRWCRYPPSQSPAGDSASSPRSDRGTTRAGRGGGPDSVRRAARARERRSDSSRVKLSIQRVRREHRRRRRRAMRREIAGELRLYRMMSAPLSGPKRLRAIAVVAIAGSAPGKGSCITRPSSTVMRAISISKWASNKRCSAMVASPFIAGPWRRWRSAVRLASRRGAWFDRRMIRVAGGAERLEVEARRSAELLVERSGCRWWLHAEIGERNELREGATTGCWRARDAAHRAGGRSRRTCRSTRNPRIVAGRPGPVVRRLIRGGQGTYVAESVEERACVRRNSGEASRSAIWSVNDAAD